MRGYSDSQPMIIAYINLEKRVPPDHPLRKIKPLADQELKRLSPLFSEMYSHTGRPSIPPERILKSLLLIALYSVRSERQFCEQMDYNLLFRWFLDMELSDEGFDPTVFTKNRERLMEHEVGRRFFDAVVRQARGAGLMSDDHFTVDGTLIEAWASLKSFRPKGEKRSDRPTDGDPSNPTVDFHGEKRRNETHQSTTDPESRLMRKAKGKEAKLSFGTHVLMENRNGILVDLQVTPATGTAETEAAEAMLKRQARRRVNPSSAVSPRFFLNLLSIRPKTRMESIFLFFKGDVVQKSPLSQGCGFQIMFSTCICVDTTRRLMVRIMAIGPWWSRSEQHEVLARGL